MNAPRLVLLSMLCLSLQSKAQQLQNTIEYIDINKIKAGHLVHGDMWLNHLTYSNSCEYPAGSGKHLGGLGSLWIAGYDPGGALRIAAQTYRQSGSDYWPGPLDTAVANQSNPILRLQYTKRWAKIWKVNKTTIESFLSLSTRTTVNTPAVILNWPAKGNIYAKGADTFNLNITRDLAPFVDVNNDGKYNALDGDYPRIKGDQMLWWIVNDLTEGHGNTHGTPLGIEVQHSVYAYSNGPKMNNVVYYEFVMRNAGQTPLTNLRFGFNADMDLGYAYDDYVGMDSARRMGFVYNSKTPDGNGEPIAYGANVPAAGLVMLEQPGDNYPNLTPAGSFATFANTPGGNPTVDSQFNFLLRSRYANGTGFSGSKYDYANFYMCDNGFPKTEDRRFVVASNDMNLLAGETKKIALALVAVENAGACPGTNLTTLTQTADTAVIVYYNPPAPLGVSSVASSKTLRIYPNPVNDILHIAPVNNTNGEVMILDALGRRLNVSVNRNVKTIEISTAAFAPSIYTIIYKDAKGTANNIFLKN